MRRAPLVLLATALGASGYTAAVAAPSSSATGLTQATPKMTWTGGPMVGSVADATDCSSSPTACDDIPVPVQLPKGYWTAHPGGVWVRIDWTAPETELDLYAFDPAGHEIAVSNVGGRNYQEVFLGPVANGTYHVHVAAFIAAGAAYAGAATLIEDRLPAAHEHPDAMTFTHSLVDPDVLATEPGISVDPAGRIYAAAPWSISAPSSFAWRSDDGGLSFTALEGRTEEGEPLPDHMPCAGTFGGADTDVLADKTGRLYFASLSGAAISVAVSTDHGQSWDCANPIANSIPEDDRPWLGAAPTADGAGPGVDAYLVYMDLGVGQFPVGRDVKPIRIHVDVTTDGGLTWSAGSTFGAGTLPTPGRPFTTANGTLYVPFQSDDGVWMATSTDNGSTFATQLISQRYGYPGNNWISGAADAAGQLYVAWVDPGTFQTLISSSVDGTVWSQPLRLSPATQATYLPWIAAGAPGDVAVAWYGADATSSPDLAPETTEWNVWVARTLNGASRQPTFALAEASDSPAHLGPLCTLKSCGGNHSALGDFLQVALTEEGSAIVSYADNARADSTINPPYPYVVVARQTAGVGMRHVDQAPASEPKGDALWPPNDAAGTDVASLDLVRPPTAVLADGLLHVTMSVADALDLTTAMSAGPGGSADQVQWLLLWKAHNRIEYAEMTLTSGGHTFGGGDEPTPVLDPTKARELIATYPGSQPLSGKVTPTGAITIEIPLAAFHLQAHDVLTDLQAFTITSSGQVGEANLPNVIDSTPAVTLSF